MSTVMFELFILIINRHIFHTPHTKSLVYKEAFFRINIPVITLIGTVIILLSPYDIMSTGI